MELMQKIRRNHESEEIINLITNGADVDYVDSTGYSVLIQAIKRRRSDVVSVLLQHDANPDQSAFLIETGVVIRPLYLAIEMDDLDLATKLIDADADLYWNNPLCMHLAVRRGELDMIQLLIDRGAKLDSLDDDRKSPFDIWIESLRCAWIDNERAFQILDRLLMEINRLKLPATFPWIPKLIFTHGSVAIVKRLQSIQMRISCSCSKRQAAIIAFCACNRSKDMLRYVVTSEHLDVNSRYFFAGTPLMFAAEFAPLCNLKALIKLGAHVHPVNCLAHTALTRCINYDCDEPTENFLFLMYLSPVDDILCVLDQFIIKGWVKHWKRLIETVAFMNSLLQNQFINSFVQEQVDDIKDYFEICDKELNIARSISITPSLNYFHILTIDKRSNRVADGSIFDGMDDTFIFNSFPIYGPRILARLKRIITYQNLLRHAKFKFERLVTQDVSCNPILRDMILHKLRMEDLRNLCKI